MDVSTEMMWLIYTILLFYLGPVVFISVYWLLSFKGENPLADARYLSARRALNRKKMRARGLGFA